MNTTLKIHCATLRFMALINFVYPINFSIMKRLFLVLLFAFALASCDKMDEVPLLLPSAAEPSAKNHNDRGIKYFHKGKYMDALIAFTQASVADSTAGEIHFNLALMQHQQGKQDKAKDHFKLARKFADGNKQILESKLLIKYLGR